MTIVSTGLKPKKPLRKEVHKYEGLVSLLKEELTCIKLN